MPTRLAVYTDLLSSLIRSLQLQEWVERFKLPHKNKSVWAREQVELVVELRGETS